MNEGEEICREEKCSWRSTTTSKGTRGREVKTSRRAGRGETTANNKLNLPNRRSARASSFWRRGTEARLGTGEGKDSIKGPVLVEKRRPGPTVKARKSISSMKMPIRFWMALIPFVDRPEPRYRRPRSTGEWGRGREGGREGGRAGGRRFEKQARKG
jgi:hypothetical protein